MQGFLEVQSGTEQRIKTSYVIGMKMRKTNVIERQDIRKLEIQQTTLAAIEQHTLHGLSSIDTNEQSIVAINRTQYFPLETHEYSIRRLEAYNMI